MTPLDEIEIDGQRFFVPGVERAEPKPHQCVCLLIKGPEPDPKVLEGMRRAARAAGMDEDVLEDMLGHKDKCKRMVDNPDQPFCDDCENAGHPEQDNQEGIKK